MQRIQHIKKYVLSHKVASSIGLIVFVLLGSWAYGKLTSTSAETRYVTANATTGNVIASISGTGQVSASNQVDIKSKASGDVVLLNVVNGQEVKAGTLIAQIDARDAQKAVRDAQVNLQSAQLALDKLQQPADTLSLIQAQNSLDQAKESKQTAEDDLKKAYDDGFNTVANAFLDLPSIMTGLDDMFLGNTIDRTMVNITWYVNQTSAQNDGERDKALRYKDDFYTKYNVARTAYDKNSEDYKSASRVSDTNTIEALINETYETTRDIADTVKTGNNLVDFVKDALVQRNTAVPAIIGTHQASLNTYTGTTNAHLSSLLSIEQTIQSSKEAIVNADRTIAEKTEAIAKLKAGADPLDVQSQQLSLQQRKNALIDAQEKLADYYIRAPFDGTIATLNVKKADTLSSGTSIATFITKQRLAEISLNEVDVAKVKVGQKATLTFDAVDGLTISGSVAEIDTVGTVSQGVVTYAVKIGFDTQDDHVKPGMSVSAAIITDMKQNVLTVPNSAVKTQGNASYVEMFTTPLANASGTQGTPSAIPPVRQTVEVGISDDTTTEIVSGLKEGDQVVTRMITSTQTTTQTAPSLFPTGGGRNLGR